jgi:hypothetical protein
MNELSSTESAPAFPGGRQVVILGIGLLAGLLMALGLILWDNSRRTELETIVESTAVGDTRYFVVPDPAPPEPYPPAVHLQGKPLVPSGYKRHEKREAELQPVGKDEATGLAIYQAPVKAKDKDKGEPPTYFLKTGRGEFIKVKPAGTP